MPTRNVVLTNYQASYVEGLVASGRYQNASEVLREGLRLVELRDKEDAARLDALRRAVMTGVSDFESGNFVALDTPDRLNTHLQALASQAIERQ